MTFHAFVLIDLHCTTLFGSSNFTRRVTTQAGHFSNAKHTILSPEGGENRVFRGKY